MSGENPEMPKRSQWLLPAVQNVGIETLYKELEIWAAVSWGIWNARNRIYLERVQPLPKAILAGAVGFLQEYQNLNNAQRNSGES